MRASFVQPDLETWLKKFQFFADLKVRFSETDALGHLNNVSYFTYFEQGRVEYLEHLGLLEPLLLGREGGMIVTADLECHYLAQVYFNERLKLGVRTARIGRSSLEVEYALKVPERNLLAAAGRGAVVYIDRQTGKSTPLPDWIKQKIAAFEGLS